jgi:hypothetical protein
VSGNFAIPLPTCNRKGPAYYIAAVPSPVDATDPTMPTTHHEDPPMRVGTATMPRTTVALTLLTLTLLLVLALLA